MPASLKALLSEDNPHIYAITSQKDIAKAHAQSKLGVFDAKLSLAYENKEYPKSSADFESIFLSKALFSGVDLKVGHRKALGTQESNNIKTSDEGELLAGLHLSVIELLGRLDARNLAYKKSLVETTSATFASKNAYRLLYLDIVRAYFKLLYERELLLLSQELLRKSQTKRRFIAKSIHQGVLPKVDKLAIDKELFEREQFILTRQSAFAKALNELAHYVNLDATTLQERYTLPSLHGFAMDEIISLEEAIKRAYQNRSDIKALQTDYQSLALQTRYNEQQKYPKVALGLYSVYDYKYEEGTKFTLHASYPLQRRAYLGQKERLKYEKMQLDAKQQQRKLQIKAHLSTLFTELQNIQKSIAINHQEIALAKELARLETKKYQLGASTLMRVNEREIASLNTQKRLLDARLASNMLYQEYLSAMELF